MFEMRLFIGANLRERERVVLGWRFAVVIVMGVARDLARNLKVVKELELRQLRWNCVSLDRTASASTELRQLRWNCVNLTDKVIVNELELCHIRWNCVNLVRTASTSHRR